MSPVSESPHARAALLMLAALGAFGCKNLDHFDTKPGDSYCGAILSNPSFQDGFIKENTKPQLYLSLTLDTSNLTSVPGFLRSNDQSFGLCSDQELPVFQNAPMRAIPEVDNDAIATLSFGEGHEHDFFVWVDSTCQGTMLGVVSLMKNDQVELRLFKPERLPPADATSAEKPGFAVFHMALRHTPCF